MKTAYLSMIAMLFASAAFADAEFFETNGCDSEYLIQTEDGYYNNTHGKGCKADRGDTGAAGKVKPVAVLPPTVPVDPEPEAPCKSCAPETS